MGKRQADYTISDIIRLKPSWLQNKQTSLDKFNQKMHQIAVMMDHGFNYISNYKFNSVFGTYDISEMEMNEINKLISEYTESDISEPLEGNSQAIEIAKSEGTLNFKRSFFLDRIASIASNIKSNERRIKSNIRDARYHMSEAQNKQEANSRYQAEIEDIESRIEKEDGLLDKNKLKILQNIPDHWHIVEIGERDFTVLRLKEVIMNETNADAGLNRFINMGYYGFKITYALDDIERIGFCNNIIGPGLNLHPHVSSYTCWGSIEGQAQRAKESIDTVEYFSLLDRLLETYNSGSPFTPYEKYQRMKNTNRKRVSVEFYEKYPYIFEYIKNNTEDEGLSKAIDQLQSIYNPEIQEKINSLTWYNLDSDLEVKDKEIIKEDKEDGVTLSESMSTGQAILDEQVIDHGSFFSPQQPSDVGEAIRYVLGDTASLSNVRIDDLPPVTVASGTEYVLDQQDNAY